MKKLLFILILSAQFFLIENHSYAQSLRLDSIIGFPAIVTDSQQVTMTVLLINDSAGTMWYGDLAILMNAPAHDIYADTLYYSSYDSLQGNSFFDTITISHTFNAADLDGGDNIVVVWPASSQSPVVQDSLTYHLFFDTGIMENEKLQSVQLFPNPSTDFIRLRITHPEKVEQVRVFDVLGNQLLAFNNAVSKFNIQSLSSGVYFVEVRNNDHSMVVKKFFRE